MHTNRGILIKTMAQVGSIVEDIREPDKAIDREKVYTYFF